MKIICTRCKKQLKRSNKKCPACGTPSPVTQQTFNCVHCGKVYKSIKALDKHESKCKGR